MKLSTFAAIATVIGGSFLIPNPADAYPASKLNAVNNYQLVAAEGKTNTLFRGFDYNQNFPNAFRKAAQYNVASSRCPAGTRYHTIKVGGLIKRTAAQGCFTDFQASQLRMQANANQQQRIRNFQRNLNESFRTPVNCTTNVYGNTGYTNCY